ncbi:hypothetical protein ABH926_001810 [Catenulispora sp. GP43]|uniref:hypothetical protein n=1 Tax=Catenulispora sp. GP43 TaxID=3156263 RepID=UPI003514E449
MSIEDNETAAVRGLLGTAFAAPEPPLRDLASGSIARGDSARRRNRMIAAGGATLSVVAVLGTFALVTGAGPAGHRTPNPVNPATSTAITASPTGNLAFGPQPAGVDKTVDVKVHVAALLQPLLPSGITAGQVPPGGLPGEGPTTAFLTGPSGTNQVEMWVGTAPADDAQVRQATCSGGTCTTRSVEGGTVYLDDHSTTAADYVRGAGLKTDVLKAGTDKTVVLRTLSMVFVPTDRSKYAFSFTQSTHTAKVQYADHEPSDYMTGGEWPPQDFSTISANDPSGLLMTPDDYAAMLGKPGLDKLEYLLDPRTAVSQETKNRFASTEAQIAAAAQAALPTGVKASVDTGMMQTQLMVTGPTGKNQLRWSVDNQTAQSRQQWLGWCPPNVTCTKRTVPGGTLLVWAEKPMDSKGTILDQTPSSYEYWLFPDDFSKPSVTMTLATSADQTGLPGKSEPDPGNTYSVTDGPYAPVQVSADQFLAVAQSGQLATAITTTTSLLKTLG